MVSESWSMLRIAASALAWDRKRGVEAVDDGYWIAKVRLGSEGVHLMERVCSCLRHRFGACVIMSGKPVQTFDEGRSDLLVPKLALLIAVALC